MRYFTRQMWLSAQKAENFQQYERDWQAADLEYRTQLVALAPRLHEDAYRFFDEADVHDGELMELVIGDGSRPAPIRETARPWKASKEHPVTTKLSVLEANDELLWTLAYNSLRRVVVDFSVK